MGFTFTVPKLVKSLDISYLKPGTEFVIRFICRALSHTRYSASLAEPLTPLLIGALRHGAKDILSKRKMNEDVAKVLFLLTTLIDNKIGIAQSSGYVTLR